MGPYYFTSVKSKTALANKTRLNQLGQELPAASSWTNRELFAFRVVVSLPSMGVLPLFAGRREVYLDLMRSDDAFKALKAPTPPNLPTRTETDLVRENGVTLGQFWAALADILAGIKVNTHDEDDSMDEDAMDEDEMASSSELPPLNRPLNRSRRVITPMTHEGMVNSTDMQVGSSSPTRPSTRGSTGQPFIPQTTFPVESRELETQRLVFCFLRHVFYATPYDLLDQDIRLECRVAQFGRVHTQGGWCIQAEDDGGLRQRRRLGTSVPHAYDLPPRPNWYYTLLEAKRHFYQFDIDGKPVISDAWLGQMTAEALVGRLARKECGNHAPDVFVIAAALHYVCFLHFSITDEYLADVERDTPDHTLPVHSTRWLDLGDAGDRALAAANVIGLLELPE